MERGWCILAGPGRGSVRGHVMCCDRPDCLLFPRLLCVCPRPRGGLGDSMLEVVRPLVQRSKPRIRDAAAELLYRSGLTRPQRANLKALTIATFHRVLPEPELREYPIPEIAMTDVEFDWFMAYFKRTYDARTLSDALATLRAGTPARPILAITFDDGQLDNYRIARPILARYGLAATFFVTGIGTRDNAVLWHDEAAYAVAQLQREGRAEAAGLLAELNSDIAFDDPDAPKRVAAALKVWPAARRAQFIRRLRALTSADVRPTWDGMMNLDQLKELVADGHEIGCHTDSHAILPLCDDAELDAEVGGARAFLEREVGVSVRTFCYPNGDWDDRTERAVQGAGFDAGVTTRFDINPLPLNAIRLSRCDMQGATARDARGRMSEARLCLRLSGIQNRLKQL